MDIDNIASLKFPPLIFLHIGDIFYLKYTLKSAVFHNQNIDVILIGDNSNKKYEKLGVKHFNYCDYLFGQDIKEFEACYQLIGGTRFLEINSAKGNDWTRYNFLKWFVLRNFLEKHRIKSCWTFDSDNMILCNLNKKNFFFEHLDCTVRPAFSMIMGKINNLEVLQNYCATIINLFKDKKFLDEQRQEFIDYPNYGFTMMRAFMKFHEKYNNIYRIDTFEKIVDKEIFLDTLFRKREGLFVLNNKKEGKTDIKQIFRSGAALYVQETKNKSFIRLNSIDLSWLPDYYFSQMLKISTSETHNNNKVMSRVKFSITASYWVRNRIYILRKHLRI